MRPLDRDEAPGRVFSRNLKCGKLAFQHCKGCGMSVFPPRVLCPTCGSYSLEWQESSGRGTVYAATAVYHREGEPHNVALVELGEGFRMMSRVEGLPAEDVEIGMEVIFEMASEKKDGEDTAIAVFKPLRRSE